MVIFDKWKKYNEIQLTKKELKQQTKNNDLLEKKVQRIAYKTIEY